jgi:phosphoenolpyruvate carboxykinase (GTP)
MSMRPFLSYSEGDYAGHWLDVIGKADRQPIFAHVNWFRSDSSGRYLWPGYGENLRALLWLLDFAEGRVKGQLTPIGTLPREGELNLEALSIELVDLKQLLSYDLALWRTEARDREPYLGQFRDLPSGIWDVHNRLSDALALAGASLGS